MRPVSIRHSPVRCPLDVLLGTEANVRLLRVLAHEVDAPVGAATAARLAGLTPAGARRALGQIVRSGVVERIGRGRVPQYCLRRQDPLVQPLGLLFARERERYDSFVTSLRKALADLREVRTVWLDRLPTEVGDPVEITVVAEAKAVSWLGEELRSRLIGLEKELDLVVEVALFTRADAPSPGPEAIFLRNQEAGVVATRRHPPRSHVQAEERALHLARGIAELLRTEPSLVVRARRHLDNLLRENQGNAAGDLAEWRQLLDAYSPGRLADLLVSRSSRAARLRQSAPFFAVLTAEERDRILASLEKRK